MPTPEELKRKKVQRTDHNVSFDDLSGLSLLACQKQFELWQDKYGHDAVFEVREYGYDSAEVYITYMSEETDDEYEKRIKRIEAREFKAANPLVIQERRAKIEEKKAAIKREADLKLLAELKKKYEQDILDVLTGPE